LKVRTSLHHLVEEAATTRGAAPALTYRDLTVSYAELWQLTRAVAAGLIGLGQEKDDRVAIYIAKRIETVGAIFGTSAAAGVFVPINHIVKAPQAGYIIRNCAARVLVTTSDRLAVLSTELSSCPSVEHVVLIDLDGEATHRDTYQIHPWSNLIRPGSESLNAVRGSIDVDMAAILYTSGSTGKPKGVVLSHRNLIAGAESVSSYLNNTADDVILSALPLSFDAGLSQLTTAFAAGAHVILMNYLLPGEVPKLCAKHEVTGLTCVPPLWLQIADLSWPPQATQSMRYFANTGGRMPRPTLQRLRTIFPQAAPYLMYGLTEAFRSTYLDPAEVDRRPDSIGKAIPNAEIMVVRPDGTQCHSGEEGELVHRGALVALGYWGDPLRTAERFKPAPGASQDWRATELAVWSGDRVVADQDGFLYFVGRQDEMIKTSGYRVSPTEVEEVAYDSGLVRDAVALGVEDSRLGQRIVLLVSPRNGAELDSERLASMMRRQLPLYMVPSHIQIRADLPRSPNGKFDRSLLRQEMSS
jgi:acyl-CoA ligase (AMP-forming) (exosortase A-associated)